MSRAHRGIIGLAWLVVAALLLASVPVFAAGPRFDPDNEKDSINWDKLPSKFGPVPTPSTSFAMGSIMKFMGNPYWKLLAKGMQEQGEKYHLSFEVQAAISEADQAGQTSEHGNDDCQGLQSFPGLAAN